MLAPLAACSDGGTVADNGTDESETETMGDESESESTESTESTEAGDGDGDGDGEMCGDDLREGSEECDEGDLNADDWNCMADCTINPNQRLIFDLDEASIAASIAAGANRSTDQALVGDGFWCNAPGKDLNEDTFDKFECTGTPKRRCLCATPTTPTFATGVRRPSRTSLTRSTTSTVRANKTAWTSRCCCTRALTASTVTAPFTDTV